MKQYKELLQRIVDHGDNRDDRTGVGTLALFGEQLKLDLGEGFPLLTTKKVFFKGVVHELLWMLSGSTNIKYLQENGVHIWDEWADDKGELGPVYGYQWRNFNGQGIDQIKNVVELLKTSPHSRRIIVLTGNPAQEKEMRLPPCPYMFQMYQSGSGLSMHVYQRSCDFFLGAPFDIASYALLLSMLGEVINKRPRLLIFSYGDVHLYKNHVEQAKEQLSRSLRPLPSLDLAFCDDIDKFKFEDIRLVGYDPHPTIKAEIAI